LRRRRFVSQGELHSAGIVLVGADRAAHALVKWAESATPARKKRAYQTPCASEPPSLLETSTASMAIQVARGSDPMTTPTSTAVTS
jgi:hypothetical protein